MAERHLILCEGLCRAIAPRAWWRVHQLPLEIGTGADVHLAVNQLTDRMSTSAPDIALDLLEVAAFVYAADQAVTRGGTTKIDYGDDWRRHFRFEMPVRCLDVWQRPDVQTELTRALEFLTDDVYEFAFHKAQNPRCSSNYLFEGSQGTEFDEVILFSGGLDSLCGAVEEVLVKKHRVLLVSHRSSTRVFARQQALFDALRTLASKRRSPVHVPVTVNKGEELNRDFTQRSRSFLFASVAAVVARLAGRSRIRFYENGVTSLNLPVSPELVGARASRTAHPQSLARFGRLFSRLFDTEFSVENPEQGRTKWEMLQRLSQRGHSRLAALTCSCGTIWGAEEDRPHCGRCSQCVDRRLSVLAAGLSDADDPPARYASDPLTGECEGPELTFAERYVGVAREILGIETPRAFAVRFPEVNAALPYGGCPTAELTRRSHELYHRHAEGVERAIHEALGRVGTLNLHSIPPRSLLGVVTGRAAWVASGRPPSSETADGDRLVVDRAKFELRFKGKNCVLGNTKEFLFVERLHQARETYLSIRTLGEDVWEDAGVSKSAVQRVASNARRRMSRELGLPLEAIDGDQKDHYRLVVPNL